MEELKKALKDAAEFENAVKTGGMLERMAVEMVLINNSSEQ